MMLLSLGREITKIDKIRMSDYSFPESELLRSYGIKDGTKIKANILDDSRHNTPENMMRLATGIIQICDREDEDGNIDGCAIWFDGYFDWDEKAECPIEMPFYEVESFEILED